MKEIGGIAKALDALRDLVLGYRQMDHDTGEAESSSRPRVSIAGLRWPEAQAAAILKVETHLTKGDHSSVFCEI